MIANGPERGSRAPSRVLVAEDDFLIAMDLEELLAGEGWGVVGPVATVKAALESIEEAPPDAALLDVDLGGERSVAIAASLRAKDVPFALVSGYSEAQLAEDEFAGAVRVSKPYNPAELVRVVKAMLPKEATPPR